MDGSDFPFVVPLEGGSNFRDLGGHRTADGDIVRRGVVFRSAHLGGLTDIDRTALGKLGVRTIVDLRGVNEAAETPHLIDGVDCRVVGAHIEPQLGDKIRVAVADGSATPHLMMQYLTDHYRDYPIALIRLSKANRPIVEPLLRRQWRALASKKAVAPLES